MADDIVTRLRESNGMTTSRSDDGFLSIHPDTDLLRLAADEIERLRAEPKLSLEEWLKYGWDKGWCSPDVCATHDGVPMTEYEMDMWDDACMHVIRLYEDTDQRLAIEKDHGPTNWRASNRGWKRNAE